MRLGFKISLLLFLCISFLYAESAHAQNGLQRAIAVQQASNPNFFQNPEVVATGVGSDANGNAIIKVYTKNANVRGIPNQAQGVPVTQSAVGVIFASDDPGTRAKGGKGKPGGGGGSTDPKARQARPVPIGVSIGTYRTQALNYCFAGTLGCRLQRINLITGDVSHYILSNNHVIAEQNAGTPVFDQVIQPGTLDSNCTLDPNDVIGQLSDFIPIQFNGQPNLVDAAIGLTSTSETGFASPADAYGAPTSNSRDATVGMDVHKFGRTTGFTQGVVDSVNATVNVQYDVGVATFTGQVIIVGSGRGRNRSFSDAGDSGSLIVAQSNNDPVGLLFAGNSSVTIANPINAVLDAFSDPGNGIIFMVDDGN